MSGLKVGFGRVDITPPLGFAFERYARNRFAEGILDPLLATAVVFEMAEKRAVVLSVDVTGMNQGLTGRARPMIAEAIGTEPEAVFLHCTHTHLGPVINIAGKDDGYIEYMLQKIRDAAVLAAADLAPATLSYTRGVADKVAFIRRFRMKDGSSRTNPGRMNPDILHPLGESDDNASLLIIKREGAAEIGIVNFQVHPDVVNGNLISADFPAFVRETYEKLIDNSRCMFINGAEGDTNHTDVSLADGYCVGGYSRARYMGRKIAMSVIADYELAQPISLEKGIRWGQKNIFVKHNKGRPDQLEEAARIAAAATEFGAKVAVPYATGMERVTIISEAKRIVSLANQPDEKELHMTALAIGDVVFAGFPGEPFTDVGRAVKENSKFTLTMPACCANGYEGYYPTQEAYEEGGYEARSSKYVAGTGEQVIAASTELINSL